jgi:hypothetical protein
MLIKYKKIPKFIITLSWKYSIHLKYLFLSIVGIGKILIFFVLSFVMQKIWKLWLLVKYDGMIELFFIL